MSQSLAKETAIRNFNNESQSHDLLPQDRDRGTFELCSPILNRNNIPPPSNLLHSFGASLNATDSNANKTEDRYPCLRRALSSNETPILPLGTYALEFGFDVTSFPFTVSAAKGNNLSLEDSRIYYEQEDYGSSSKASSDDESSALLASASPTSPLLPFVKIEMEENNKKNLTSTCLPLTESLNLSQSETRANEHKVNRQPCCKNCNSNNMMKNEQCFHILRSPGEANYYLNINETRQLMKIEKEIEESSNNEEMQQQQQQQHQQINSWGLIEDNNCHGNNSDVPEKEKKLKVSCKKDSRSWLWKSSAKKYNVMTNIDYWETPSDNGGRTHSLAKQWKKDNRTWLWKSSWKRKAKDDKEQQQQLEEKFEDG